MAAFKRPGSKTYYIGPMKAGPIDVPRMTTGVQDKNTARAIEISLKELAVTGFDDLVQLVADKKLNLLKLYVAKIQGREALEALRTNLNDRPLGQVAKEVRTLLDDWRVRDVGMDQLLALVPDDARVSWLTEPKNVTRLYQRAVAGEDREDGRPRAKNTVHRSVHQAVSEILKHEFGRARMRAVMADVKIPRAKDERVVTLTPDEVAAFLEAADPQFRPWLGLAVTTGIDQGPMLRGLVRDYDEQGGTLQVRDTKTASRPRTLVLRDEPVLQNAEYWLRQLIAGRGQHDRLVPVTHWVVRRRFKMVASDLGRADLRWKDLRGVFATYYLLAGGDARTLQDVLGHSTMVMTLRYLRRLPVGNRERLREDAARLGRFGKTHLRVIKGA